MILNTFYSSFRERRRVRNIAMAFYLMTAMVYLSWRTTIFNPEAMIFSWVFYLAEIMSFLLACMMIFVTWDVRVRKAMVAKPGKSVDIFIPTYNESVEMLRLTVLAAMKIRYPHETWLLDDGRRPEMKALAKELGCNYLTRDSNEGNKSGNLNNAMKFAKADFICVLDSDHVAQSSLLDRLLGYFDEDKKLAFVQAPQDYYNLSAFQFHSDSSQQMLWQDQIVFYSVGQAGRDYWGAASCCGTGVVFRRKAIEDIGGFPPETVTEDMHMSIKMQKLGYTTAYYPSPVSYGVAPTDYGSFLRQRLRWGQGNVQTWRLEFLPWPRGLNWKQIISYTSLAAIYIEGWIRLIFYITPPILLLTGYGPIGDTPYYYFFFIPYFIAMWFYYEEMTHGNMRVFTNEQLAMARFPIYIASTFGLFLKRIRWLITSKEFIGHLPVYLLMPQFAVIAFNLAALLVTLIAPVDKTIHTYTWPVLSFVMFWCVVNIVFALLVVKQAVKVSMLKRPDYRFQVPMPVALDTPSSDTFGYTSGISTKGMTLIIDNVLLPVGSELSGCIYPANQSIPFRATIVRELPETEGKKHVECEFDWDNKEEYQDRLNLSLHSCDWHRRYVYQGLFFITPLERVTNFLGITHTSRPQTTDWRPYLYREQCNNDDRFTLLGAQSEDKRLMIMTFSELADKQVVRVLNVSKNPSEPEYVKITGLVEDEYEAGSGPDDAIARVYHVERCNAASLAEPVPVSGYSHEDPFAQKAVGT